MPEPKGHPPFGCKNFNNLKEPRIGVMLHYDDSTSDSGALAWFKDPECKVSYNYLVLDNGDYVPLLDEEKRAWHAGLCRTSSPARLRYNDANSAFLGISVATNGKIPATAAQLETVAWLTRRYFQKKGWPLSETWRIVGHDTEAVYGQNADVPVHLRGKRGRKIDPTGPKKDRPILSVAEVRKRVAGA
jgi:N-acetyl-anhydromuramyl-L-alanine amidase AmpD